jgi:hypothetical protein
LVQLSNKIVDRKRKVLYLKMPVAKEPHPNPPRTPAPANATGSPLHRSTAIRKHVLKRALSGAEQHRERVAKSEGFQQKIEIEEAGGHFFLMFENIFVATWAFFDFCFTPDTFWVLCITALSVSFFIW